MIAAILGAAKYLAEKNMDFPNSFRFIEDDLNRRLISLLKKSDVSHFIDKNGLIHYSPDDEELLENDLIGSIRGQVFSSWQVLTCPKEWVEAYKSYMAKHDIPFKEELINDDLWFLIPRKFRPQLWKLADHRKIGA